MSGLYELVEAEGGSLPTIIDENGHGILAIDTRTIQGKTYVTPVFASHAVAERVVAALNGDPR